MKKFLKILGITIVSILAILYLCFLFVLPNIIDLNQFKPEIQKILKEQTNLTLDFDNPKISVTPFLAAGLKADNVSVKLPDNSNLFTADSFVGRISLPNLLLLRVKVSTAEINNPLINIDIVDGKAFKVVQAFEEILNKKEENLEETIEENIQTAQKPIIDPASIKIIVPAVNINNYAAVINDLKTGDYLKLKGDKLTLGYNNGKSASIKTNAELFINETKNINANINIDTFLPAQTVLDEEDDEAQRVEIPFVNPVAMYKSYDLKTNIDSKIKIRQNRNQLVSKGYFNVDNFTLKLAGMQLPESNFHLKTRGTKANLDTNLYITESEKLSVLGLINYSKNPAMDLKIESNEIYTNDVLNLVKATLDSLHIQHELNTLKGEGYLISNANIKTNFKKLKSNGNITIKNLIIRNIKNNQILTKINSVISLDNNMLEFLDTTIEAADTTFKIDGTIKEKDADINLMMERMPLLKVFTLFLPSEINEAYKVNAGDIDLQANIKGELKKAIGNLKLTINNIDLTDKINNINYLNNLLVIDFNSNFKTTTGKINNSDFKLKMNGATIACDKLSIEVGEKDIILNPSEIKINNSTRINVFGDIKNYIKNPIFNFDIDGNLITKDLKKLLGSDIAPFIKENGVLPLSANINGNSKKQTIKASIEANQNNYITPIDIQNVLNQNTKIQTVIDLKGDRLKIKDTGFFIKRLVADSENPENKIEQLEEIIGINGTITKLNTTEPNINLIKVKIPKDLNASIYAFPQSKLMANGNMYIFGDLYSPRIRGNIKVWNMAIPELFLTMQNAIAKFEGKDLNIDINRLIANGSDYDVRINADLNPSANFIINNLDLNSQLTDADKLMKVSDAAMKYTPTSTTSNTANGTANAADIPVIIKDGDINIQTIKTGNIILNNTTGDIALSKNIFYINNLLTNAFQGRIRGDVSMNLLSGEIKAKLRGKDLDVEQTLLDAAAMKDTLTGTMDFDTNISLKGATYEEQMKTLKGEVNFLMKNGQLGPFGKLENLIMAENIRESAFFQSTIGSVLNSLLSFDTSKYNELKGKLTFKDGIANINPITSQGNIMCAHIFGDFNLLTNKIDIKLRGRLGSQVSDSLGPLSLLNPVNLVKATPGMSIVLGKLFFLFTEAVTEDELNLIPSLGKDISDYNSTKFQVVLRGDVEKPLTLVKSFKWLALQSEIDNAKAYVNALPQDTIPTIDINTFDKEEIKTQVKETAKKKLKEKVESNLTEEQIQSIEQGKETANKLKNLFKNKEEAKNSIKEQTEKAKLDALNKLKEQAKQSISVPITEPESNSDVNTNN